MADSEHTSKAIASLAAKGMGMEDDEVRAMILTPEGPSIFRSICASAVTQAPDHERKGQPKR